MPSPARAAKYTKLPPKVAVDPKWVDDDFRPYVKAEARFPNIIKRHEAVMRRFAEELVNHKGNTAKALAATEGQFSQAPSTTRAIAKSWLTAKLAQVAVATAQRNGQLPLTDVAALQADLATVKRDYEALFNLVQTNNENLRRWIKYVGHRHEAGGVRAVDAPPPIAQA